MNSFNRISRLALVLLLGNLVMACSSQPIIINYYLLNISEPTKAQLKANPNDTSILITDILLPDYLSGSNLVMQQTNGTLSVATKHVWAQPLDSGFGTLLANSLSQYDDLTGYYAARSGNIMERFSTKDDIQLAVIIEHFMPIESGEVVLTGYWQISMQGVVEKPNRFDLKASLTADGYIHSVDKMRELVQDLASVIKAQLVKERSSIRS